MRSQPHTSQRSFQVAPASRRMMHVFFRVVQPFAPFAPTPRSSLPSTFPRSIAQYSRRPTARSTLQLASVRFCSKRYSYPTPSRHGRHNFRSPPPRSAGARLRATHVHARRPLLERAPDPHRAQRNLPRRASVPGTSAARTLTSHLRRLSRYGCTASRGCRRAR